MASKSKTRGGCPYCGRNKVLTKEHVIPQTFFIEPDPNMVTVQICHQCNQEMSPHIRDLRNWVALSLETINHPDAIAHLRKIYETNEATRKWVAKALATAEEADFVTPSGEVTGTVLLFDFNKERARQALARIIKGLYFVTTGTSLPLECPVSAIEVPIQAARETLVRLSGITHEPAETRGNHVVSWVPYLETDSGDPNDSMWILTFLQGACFFGGTGRFGELLEANWQRQLASEKDFERVNGRIRLEAPLQPDGTYYTPPGQ
jgi:hypothetical protein